MYSVCVDRENNTWDDIKYTRHSDLGYVVWLGARRIGLVLGKTKRFDGWWAIPEKRPATTVRGFISRWKAMEYLLEVEGYPRYV